MYGGKSVDELLLCQKGKLKNGVLRLTVECYLERREVLLWICQKKTLCDVIYLQITDESSSCSSRVGERQPCFTEAAEGFSDAGAAAVWHKAFIADFVSLGAGLDAISGVLVVQGGTGRIPDTM